LSARATKELRNPSHRLCLPNTVAVKAGNLTDQTDGGAAMDLRQNLRQERLQERACTFPHRQITHCF